MFVTVLHKNTPKVLFLTFGVQFISNWISVYLIIFIDSFPWQRFVEVGYT